MGLFSKMFEKKICDLCGEEIKLLGNKKLEDGNMCKNCANKLSPFFSDRRRSTVEQIKEQLQYREANKDAVAVFHVTRSFGEGTKVLLDDDAKKFMVTSARDYVQANPDVMDFSSVTGVNVDIDEIKREAKTKDSEGRSVSYNPPRYFFEYDVQVIIRVNNPYFDEITVTLNSSNIRTNEAPMPALRKPDPRRYMDFVEYENQARELKEILTGAAQESREAAQAAAAPKQAVVCPLCGATTLPDANGCCEYCGGPVNL